MRVCVLDQRTGNICTQTLYYYHSQVGSWQPDFLPPSNKGKSPVGRRESSQTISALLCHCSFCLQSVNWSFLSPTPGVKMHVFLKIKPTFPVKLPVTNSTYM